MFEDLINMIKNQIEHHYDYFSSELPPTDVSMGLSGLQGNPCFRHTQMVVPSKTRTQPICHEPEISKSGELITCEEITYELYDYQRRGVEWMEKRESIVHHGIRGGIIAAEMGLGKTFMALYHSLNSLPARKERSGTGQTSDQKYPTLVVCSLTLIDNWVSHGVEKFYPNKKYFVVHKTYFEENENFNIQKLLDVDIVITTYDVCVSLCTKNNLYDDVLIRGIRGIEKDKIVGYKQIVKPKVNYKIKGPLGIYHIPWTRVICDESQKFSNSKTKTFRSVLRLYGDYKWCLTGTPIRNDYKDIWSQLVFCKYYSKNISNTSVTRKRWTYNTFVKEDLIKVIYTLSFDSKDVKISLPPKNIHVEYIYMEGEQLDYYKAHLLLLKKNINDFLRKRIKKFTVILTLFLRLRQICVTPTLIIENKTSDIIMTPKLDAILNLITKYHQNEKILVYSGFQGVLDVLSQVFEDYEIGFYMLTGKIKNTKKRTKILNDFKADEINNVLLINYKVGSEGLNIIEATRGILDEHWWNNATHDQAIARTWRIGQTKEVNAHFFINKGSIEERIMLLNKRKTQQSINLLQNTGTMNKKIKMDLDTIRDLIRY